MCTLGFIKGSYLFKTRDLWVESNPEEEVVHGLGRYSYVGVQGHASPLERGLNSGINEKGVAVAITFVDTVPLDEALRIKNPRGVLVEEILRNCGDLASVLKTVTEYFSIPLVGGNIVVATRDGGFVLEQLYPKFAIELINEPVAVRTNHFLNLRTDGKLHVDEPNSIARFNRMQELLGDGSQVDIDQVKNALSDHQSEYPVCSHGGELRTVSASIYDLHAKTLYHTAGHPCSTAWKSYKAEFTP